MFSIKDLSFKAILIGFLVDILGSSIVAGIIGFIIGYRLGASGVPPTEIPERLAQMTGMQIVALIVGLLFSMFGGYVAALVAKENEIQNATATGVFSVIIALLSTLIFTQSAPLWFNVAAYLLTIPAAYLGGYLRLQQDQ